MAGVITHPRTFSEHSQNDPSRTLKTRPYIDKKFWQISEHF